jgi:hypothetical protein
MNKKGIHKLLALALALALAVTVLPGAALAQETADTGAQDTQAAVWDEGQPAPDGEELTQDGALEEEPPHRVRVLDTGYDEQARIEALMENIALGYAESSSDAWHVMGVRRTPTATAANTPRAPRQSWRIWTRLSTMCRGTMRRTRRSRRPS